MLINLFLKFINDKKNDFLLILLCGGILGFVCFEFFDIYNYILYTTLFLVFLIVLFVYFFSFKNLLFFFIFSLVVYQAVSVSIGATVTLSFIVYIVLASYFLFINKNNLLNKILSYDFCFEEKMLFFFAVTCVLSIVQSVYIPEGAVSVREDKLVGVHGIRSCIIAFSYLLGISAVFVFPKLFNKYLSIDKLLKAYIYIMSILSFLCLYAYASFLSLLPKFEILNFLVYTQSFCPRIKGTALEPASFIVYIIVACFLSLLFFFKEKNKKYILFFLLFSIISILTIARGGILALFLGIFCFFVLGVFSKIISKKRVFLFVAIFFVFVSVTICLYIYNDMVHTFIEERIVSVFMISKEGYAVKDLSASIRIVEYSITAGVFRDFPVLGVGVGNLVYHSSNYFVYIPWVSDFMGTNFCIVANLFCLFLIETGLIGLSFFLLFFFGLFFKAVYYFFLSQNYDDKIILLSLISLLVSLFVCLLFFPETSMLIWFVFAIVVFVNKKIHENKQLGCTKSVFMP